MIKKISSEQKLDAALTLSAVAFLVSLGAIFLIILLWNTSDTAPEISYLSFSMTVLQTFLAITALGGFWLIRSAAIERAEATAKELLGSKSSELEEIAKLTARRAALDFLEDNAQGSGPMGNASDIADALDGGDNG